MKSTVDVIDNGDSITLSCKGRHTSTYKKEELKCKDCGKSVYDNETVLCERLDVDWRIILLCDECHSLRKEETNGQDERFAD